MMSLLFPLGLLGLFSVPALLWLWRLSKTHRQTKVASLIPFEHLLAKQPRRRARLIVNLLFWLQLAACVALALALARPMFRHAAVKTILVIVDTSASMQAVGGASRVFDQGLGKLRQRMDAQGPFTQWFVMASAPVTALTPTPVATPGEAERLIRSFGPQDLAGNLAAAAQIGQALLGQAPATTLILSDEAPLSGLEEPGVEWISVGRELPNVALVGVDAEPLLCGGVAASSRLVAVVENLSDAEQSVRLAVRQEGRQLSQQTVSLAAGVRSSVPLAISNTAQGWIEVEIVSPKDALALDNRATVFLRQSEAVPVAVVSEDAAFRTTIALWLNACEGLVWSVGVPEEAKPFILITDDSDIVDPRAIGTIRFADAASQESGQPAYWLIEEEHAIGRYLAGVEPAGVRPSASITQETGKPVVWALTRGARTPVVSALEEGTRRTVTFALSAPAARDSSQVLVTFLNSLRWMIASAGTSRTGEPLALPLASGAVNVTRPDGVTERLPHAGGLFSYDGAAQAGLYRFAQAGQTHVLAANFLDPLESNLRQRAHTWRPGVVAASTEKSATTAQAPLAPMLLWVVVALLLLEWWAYSRKARGAPIPDRPGSI